MVPYDSNNSYEAWFLLWRLRSLQIPSNIGILWEAAQSFSMFRMQVCRIDNQARDAKVPRNQQTHNVKDVKVNIYRRMKTQKQILTHTRFQKNLPSWEDLSLLQGLLSQGFTRCCRYEQSAEDMNKFDWCMPRLHGSSCGRRCAIVTIVAVRGP